MRFKDSDTGESTLDVVPVPEGFSFQMGYEASTGLEIPGGYISVIVSREDVEEMRDFLLDNLHRR